MGMAYRVREGPLKEYMERRVASQVNLPPDSEFSAKDDEIQFQT